VVWASDQAFASAATAAIEAALRRPRKPKALARDVRDMRALIAREKPPSGFWDVKLAPGGLVDIEFAAQYLQLAHAAQDGPLRVHTADALAAIAEARLAEPAPLEALIEAWRLQQDLSQLMKLAVADPADPDNEPKGFQAALARAGHAKTFAALRTRLVRARAAATAAYNRLVPAAT
jgi:[glutamine synthetase] adenylyltransferase / [glutamine synthetase]-adenylyl-L-tyrosine phosphorylase